MVPQVYLWYPKSKLLQVRTEDQKKRTASKSGSKSCTGDIAANWQSHCTASSIKSFIFKVNSARSISLRACRSQQFEFFVQKGRYTFKSAALLQGSLKSALLKGSFKAARKVYLQLSKSTVVETPSYTKRMEQALRCTICCDFFKAPVLLPCSHTFCSVCVRKFMQVNGFKSCCPGIFYLSSSID